MPFIATLILKNKELWLAVTHSLSMHTNLKTPPLYIPIETKLWFFSNTVDQRWWPWSSVAAELQILVLAGVFRVVIWTVLYSLFWHLCFHHADVVELYHTPPPFQVICHGGVNPVKPCPVGNNCFYVSNEADIPNQSLMGWTGNSALDLIPLIQMHL